MPDGLPRVETFQNSITGDSRQKACRHLFSFVAGGEQKWLLAAEAGRYAVRMNENSNDGGAPEAAHGSGGTDADLDGLKARENVVSREVDGEWVLYDPVSEKMHVLNVTAGLVWHQLDGTRSIDEIVVQTHQSFDPPETLEVVAKDVREVLRQFLAEDLLD